MNVLTEARAGPIFRITVAGQTQIFAASREMVHEFCDESRFQKMVMGGVERLRVLVKDGLFTARNHEEGWAIAHRIIRPALGPMKIREMFGNMHDITTQFCLKLYVEPGSERVDADQDEQCSHGPFSSHRHNRRGHKIDNGHPRPLHGQFPIQQLLPRQ